VSNIPKVIKESVLNIGRLQIKVFVLDNGKVFGEFMHHGIIEQETKKEGK
jgi:hypothetical protein